MQIPWKVDSLYQYLDMVKSGNIPDFSECCLICGAKDCATYNGCYPRSVIDPLINFFMDDFSILQYLCHQKGDNPVTHHVTFSLLPWMLIPYHRLPLLFIIFAIKIKLQNKISYIKLITELDIDFNNFYELFDSFDFINVNTLFVCKTIIAFAFNRFIESGIGNRIIDHNLYQNILNDNDNSRLLHFIDLVSNYKYEYKGQTIFGPVAFA
ncbi:hypothetical protein MHK_004757 [Candidatus Magnetomorum sp. HK-1]|nr:hypothetical protein MHK_004757 [Candidatus Magnetomorum sp. HK-1]